MSGPFPMQWDGEAMRPTSSYWQKKADERFAVGQRYILTEHMERSYRSHAHYFASLAEAWTQLPERFAWYWPTVEAFRKRGLIECGFYNERQIICASDNDAKHLAALVGSLDEFAFVSVHGPAVVVRTAKSQSQRAMDKAEFQKSKEAVLAWAWGLVGVDPETGNANAGQAA